MKVKDIIVSVVGEKNFGRLEFFLLHGLTHAWDRPFNGQSFRKKIFRDIVRHVPVGVIVETGTHRGTTALFFSKTGLPVFTVELSQRFFAYSQIRFFFHRKNVHLISGDSRIFLFHLAKEERFRTSYMFFYLDAHWNDDLPLREELEIIFSSWDRAIVMVDDFQVPGTDYGYDDYGHGKALNMKYIELLKSFRFSAFFPAIVPKLENGKKRGCVVLCRDAYLIGVLSKIDSLIPFTSNGDITSTRDMG